MSDPLRTDPMNRAPSTEGEAERDAKIESLLLSGLDRYFSSDYAQAIDVWTRALFLDRQHARARAYIERARSALAEQQRESEELLHTGVAAFERGEMETARQLLTVAVQRGGAHEVALTFLTRIDRLNTGATPSRARTAAPSAVTLPVGIVPARRGGSYWLAAVALVVAGATVGFAAVSWDEVRSVIPQLSPRGEVDLAPVRTLQNPASVPRSSETAIERARALFASGRLYDALRAVDLVRPTDPLKADADRLKGDIQRELLAHQTLPGGSVTVERPQP